MRVAVIGSRGLTVDNLGDYLPIETTEIISGGARGQRKGIRPAAWPEADGVSAEVRAIRAGRPAEAQHRNHRKRGPRPGFLGRGLTRDQICD